MYHNHPISKINDFLTSKTKSLNFFIHSNIYLLFLLFAFSLLTSSLDNDDDKNDYTALAFKPTVPSDQIQQPQQEQQPNGYVSDEYMPVRIWGTYGSGDGEFNHPFYMAIDSEDNVRIFCKYSKIYK
jgi:hypothetical protein